MPASKSSVRCIWPLSARLGEGPLWSEREQALYWTDILGCQLHRYTPESGERRSWVFHEYICAVAERKRADDAGSLIVTLKSGFAYFDTVHSALTRLHDPEPDLPGNRFNDGKVDAGGRFWAGTMDFDCEKPTGSLYRFDADGTCTHIEGGYAVSNGPAWSLDGRTMYHNDTAAGRVYAYDFDVRTGGLANRRLFLQIDESDGYPDGMTTDAQGGLWIAHFGGGKAVRFLADGTAERCIELPVSNVTSCTFGERGLRTLFITTATHKLDEAARQQQPLAGGLFSIEIPGIHGLPANRFAG
jgi:xylono-1,5-lactonase